MATTGVCAILEHLERANWDADAVRADVLEYARRALGEGGILAVDETGFLKKGEKSVGVARQYTGTAGKVENAQVGVFLSRYGRRTRSAAGPVESQTR